jgi:ABC-type phosphate transport system substrate-binding protein
MNNRRKIAVASVIAAVAALTALTITLSRNIDQIPDGSVPDNTTDNSTGNVPITNKTGGPADDGKPKPVINVISSPSAFPFVEKWVTQYNNEGNLGIAKVDYSNEVDDANVATMYSNVSDFLAHNSADLAITGLAVPASGNFTDSESLFLPASPQAIVIVYNVPSFPDIPSGLRLDAPTLSAILGGNITHWDDPKIKELNPDMNLPNERITVVHEGQAGSASDLLDRYLLLTSNRTIDWPEGSLTGDSADNLSTIVRQTPYSIGYVDFSYAIQTKMTYAALQNSDGEYVSPSIDSIDRAIQNGTVIEADDDCTGIICINQPSSLPPTTSVGQLGNGSYPVVGFYYAAFENKDDIINGEASEAIDADDQAAADKAAAVIDLVKWIVGERGQKILQDTQYPSIYEQNEALKNYLNTTLAS